MNDLKPCPKCNGEASIEYENYDYDGGDWWLVREADVVCQKCGLAFHVENKSREYQHGEHCLDFIVEAWNTRAECDTVLDHSQPIVRCCDCKRLRDWTADELEDSYDKEELADGWCMFLRIGTYYDFFCSWGVKRENIQ